MVKKGIADKVAIIGCDMTKYGELWNKSQYDLLFEAVHGATKDAGITKDDIDATWVGIFYYFTGLSGATVEDVLRMDGKPVTRTENYCASGMDAFRNACFGVASGAYDVVLACGVEKLTDEGSSGLPGFKIFGHPVLPIPSAPAMFSPSVVPVTVKQLRFSRFGILLTSFRMTLIPPAASTSSI